MNLLITNISISTGLPLGFQTTMPLRNLKLVENMIITVQIETGSVGVNTELMFQLLKRFLN